VAVANGLRQTTSATANPTLTIAARILRAADQVKATLQQ